MFGSKKRLAQEIAVAEKQAITQVLQRDPVRGLENARRLGDLARERGDKPAEAYWAILIHRYGLAVDEQDPGYDVLAALRKAAIDTAFREADGVHLQADAAKSIRTIEKVLKGLDQQENPSNYAYFVRLRERYEEKRVEQERALMGVQTHTPVDEVETAANISEEASPGEASEAEVRRLRRALAERGDSLVLASRRASAARAEIRDLKAKVYSERMAAAAARAAQRKAEQERTRSAAKAYKKGYARGKRDGVAIGERQGAMVAAVRTALTRGTAIQAAVSSTRFSQLVEQAARSMRDAVETATDGDETQKPETD